MRQLFTALAVACVAVTSVLAPAAFAQEAPATAVAPAEPVVLRVESGSVMVSQQGAEFVTVESDVSLQPEDRVLVTENAVASLDYGSGCAVGLTTGTTVVAASCPAAGVSASAGAGVAATSTNTVWIVAGVAGVAAVAVAASGGSSDDTPPVSR